MAQYVYTMNRVGKIVPPKRIILKDISLSFFPGAKIGVLGLNGSGKSSLLRIMAGEDKEFEGEAVPMPNMRIGYLPQEPQMAPDQTVREAVALGMGGSGFLNTYSSIILPFAVSWYGIFLMRQFFIGLPDELIDAARLDGAGEFRIFFVIALPLVMPGLATLGIFVFVYQWNEVIWTMTVTRTAPDLQTIPVGIYLLRGAFIDQESLSLQQAALAISILPVMITFLFLQRYYVRGLTAGAIKG